MFLLYVAALAASDVLSDLTDLAGQIRSLEQRHPRSYHGTASTHKKRRSGKRRAQTDDDYLELTNVAQSHTGGRQMKSTAAQDNEGSWGDLVDQQKQGATCWLTGQPLGPPIRPHVQLAGVNIYECPGAAIKVTYPAPSDEQLAKYYSTAGATQSPIPDGQPVPVTHRFWQRAVGQHDVIMTFKPADWDVSGKAIADVGCGFGALLKRFAEHSPHLLCYEGDIKQQAYIRNVELPAEIAKGAQLLGFATPSTLQPNSADLIMSSHVVEHIADPISTLRSWVAALKPQGLMFIEVPAEYAITTGAAQYGTGHLSFFSMPSARKMIEVVGGLKILHSGVYLDVTASSRNDALDGASGNTFGHYIRLLMQKV